MTTANYNEASIQRYAGLSGIRKKPTPYIGPTDGGGLWTILREPSDNSVDQSLVGRNDSVHIIFDSEPNKYWVIDSGQGIPVGIKEFEDEHGRKEKLSTFYVATGLTHGGSHFNSNEISRGTHGLGIKATNAMSSYFKVWTYREGKWYAIEYRNAKLFKKVYQTSAPKLPHGIRMTKGTAVCFTPDLSLFAKGSKINVSNVTDWCELTSYLVPGMKVSLTNPKGKTLTYLHKRGPAEYLEKRMGELKVTPLGKPFVFHSPEADIAVSFTNYEGVGGLISYTNGLLNSEGGEHLRSLYDALVKSLQPYKGKLEFMPSDLREGLIGVVNYKISAPQFNNQPKDKLIDNRVYPVAIPQFTKAWADFWSKHKGMAKEVCQRASALRGATNDFLKNKLLVKNIKAASKSLPAKLGMAVGCKPEDRELYIVEGDSAASPCLRARFKKYQEVWPLKGKITNAMRESLSKVAGNADIAGIFAAIGLNPDAKIKSVKSLRVGKVIFLADPDPDGMHINALLLGLFWKYMPEMFNEGMIYVAAVHEFVTNHKGKMYGAMSPDKLYEKIGTTKASVMHVKGYGELSDSVLRWMAFDPSMRRLWKVLPPVGPKGKLRFHSVMEEDSAFRKTMLNVL